MDRRSRENDGKERWEVGKMMGNENMGNEVWRSEGGKRKEGIRVVRASMVRVAGW